MEGLTKYELENGMVTVCDNAYQGKNADELEGLRQAARAVARRILQSSRGAEAGKNTHGMIK